MSSSDTSPEAAAVQLEIYRSLGAAARLRIGLELTALSRQLLEEGIRKRHPEYDADQLRWAFLRRWLGDALFHQVYPAAPELPP
jgi:hypothetical protein